MSRVPPMLRAGAAPLPNAVAVGLVVVAMLLAAVPAGAADGLQRLYLLDGYPR